VSASNAGIQVDPTAVKTVNEDNDTFHYATPQN